MASGFPNVKFLSEAGNKTKMDAVDIMDFMKLRQLYTPKLLYMDKYH